MAAELLEAQLGTATADELRTEGRGSPLEELLSGL
jgi:hypothetical protein